MRVACFAHHVVRQALSAAPVSLVWRWQQVQGSPIANRRTPSGGEYVPVGIPDFKSGEGRKTALGGFDSCLLRHFQSLDFVDKFIKRGQINQHSDVHPENVGRCNHSLVWIGCAFSTYARAMAVHVEVNMPALKMRRDGSSAWLLAGATSGVDVGGIIYVHAADGNHYRPWLFINGVAREFGEPLPQLAMAARAVEHEVARVTVTSAV